MPAAHNIVATCCGVAPSAMAVRSVRSAASVLRTSMNSRNHACKRAMDTSRTDSGSRSKVVRWPLASRTRRGGRRDRGARHRIIRGQVSEDVGHGGEDRQAVTPAVSIATGARNGGRGGPRGPRSRPAAYPSRAVPGRPWPAPGRCFCSRPSSSRPNQRARSSSASAPLG